MRAALIPLGSGNPIILQKELLLVGRQETCDLRLDHKTVSKLHCVLVQTDGLLLIRDLGSTNGCRVNGQRVTRGALLPDDILSIADFKFKIHLGPDDAPIPRVPQSTSATEQIEVVDKQFLKNGSHELRGPTSNPESEKLSGSSSQPVPLADPKD